MSSSESASDSSQTQIQDTQDNRIAAAEGSVNLVASRSSVGGNVNLTTTDFGTVNRSFDFAERLAAGAASEAAASSANMSKLALSSMQSVKDAYADSTSSINSAYAKTADNLADAYETAKAGEQKVMVVAALAVVAMVASKTMGGRN